MRAGPARRAFANLLALGAAAYLSGLLVWLTLYLLFGDANWWLFVLNAMAVYLFVPLPLVFVIALLSRRKALVLGGLMAVTVWVFLWGGSFLPKSGGSTDGPSLTVMTFNTLVFNQNATDIVDSIRHSEADVVFLLELSTYQAEALKAALGAEYPYMTLDPGNATGAGVLSKVAYREISAPELADPQWIGAPKVIELEVGGHPVTLVRFHALGLVRNFEVRERQSRKLAAYVKANDGPVIVAGDLNATPLNESYAILADVLTDSWADKGRGLGHTFPGASHTDTPGSSRPRLLGVEVPQWLVRIDVVMHSRHWQTASVRTQPYGRSDHRPVVARLVLRDVGTR